MVGTPLFFNTSYSQKGTYQIIFHVFKFNAVKIPNGGLDPGYPR